MVKGYAVLLLLVLTLVGGPCGVSANTDDPGLVRAVFVKPGDPGREVAGPDFPAAKKLAAGPMIGHTTAHSVRFWMLVHNTDQIRVQLSRTESAASEQEQIWSTDTMLRHGHYHILLGHFEGLSPETDYQLTIELDGDAAGVQPFRTFPDRPVFDFSFLTGSCAMRPPQAFRMFFPGPQESIYPVMQAIPSDFMLWLGDNLYYLLRHMNVPEQMYERRIKNAMVPEINAFVRSRPMYAIWDDHEFGPNNAKGNFALKDTSLFIHTHFWANPFNGTESVEGTFSSFQLSDVDFYLLDDRYHSTIYHDDEPAMIGKQQMDWLKERLMTSKSTFRFIVVGSQALNLLDRGESWNRYPEERQELLDFIAVNKIRNVIFLTGDRHHSELQRITLSDNLIVYDFTCSPMTSVLNFKVLEGAEADNPQRVPGTLLVDHNFGKVSVSGPSEQRHCTLAVFDSKGNPVWEHIVIAQP